MAKKRRKNIGKFVLYELNANGIEWEDENKLQNMVRSENLPETARNEPCLIFW